MTGINGDYYLKTTTGDVYQKQSGAWVLIGNIKGANGAPGAHGSVWYEDAGPPGFGIGDNGDYYLDTTTDDVYYKSGTWSVIANIRGAAGVVGSVWYEGSGAPPTGNYVVNGGFETGVLTPWVDNSNVGGSVNVGGSYAHTGSYGVQVLDVIIYGALNPDTSEIYQDLGAVPISQPFSFWYKIIYSSWTYTAHVTVTISDESGTPHSETLLDLTNPDIGDWIHVTGTTVSAYEAGRLHVKIVASAASDDGMEVFEVDSDDFSIGSGIGVDGDYYLDTDNGDVYHKESGTWVLIGSIKGATGPAGPNDITTSTTTNLTGILEGDGSHVGAISPSAPGSGLRSVVGIDHGDTAFSEKALLDTTNPADLGTAGPGTQLVAARRDHIHTLPKLDDLAAPDDGTDLDATTSRHGLSKKATAPASGLLSVLAIGNGETARSDKAIFDTTNPAMDGTAGPGTQLVAARRDHVHPSDTSRAMRIFSFFIG